MEEITRARLSVTWTTQSVRRMALEYGLLSKIDLKDMFSHQSREVLNMVQRCEVLRIYVLRSWQSRFLIVGARRIACTHRLGLGCVSVQYAKMLHSYSV